MLKFTLTTTSKFYEKTICRNCSASDAAARLATDLEDNTRCAVRVTSEGFDRLMDPYAALDLIKSKIDPKTVGELEEDTLFVLAEVEKSDVYCMRADGRAKAVAYMTAEGIFPYLSPTMKTLAANAAVRVVRMLITGV